MILCIDYKWIVLCFASFGLVAREDTTETIRKAGFVYERGLGVPIDYPRAFQFYCKAARSGDVRAAYDLGFMYFNGRGLKKDLNLAIYWMQIAAREGDALAKRMLFYFKDVKPKDDLNCQMERRDDASHLETLVRRISDSYAIDPSLVMALIQVESHFNPNAVSNKDARGLMQLRLETARRFGVQDILNPEENIKAGVAYLHWLMQRFPNNIEWVLAAYNAGEAAVERYQGVPPYQETRLYVKHILALYPGKNS